MADPTTANRMKNQGESALENEEETAVEIESKKVEWEEETKDEESGGQRKDKCEKLKKNPNHHRQMIPVEKVLQPLLDVNLAEYQLNKEDVDALRELKKDADNLKQAVDAVVKIRVQKGEGNSHHGTGLLVHSPLVSRSQAPGTSGTGTFQFAVMTNYHLLKKPKPNGTGNQPNQDNTGNQQPVEQLVEPKDIEVHFFYDSEEVFKKRGVICRVDKLLNFSISSSNSQQGEDRLDFILMTIKHPCNEAKKNSLLQLKPLLLEESERVQMLPVGTPLCIIGHPHGEPKQVTFGKLNSDSKALWREWKSENKVHGVEHVVPTCPGSSGSPVFVINPVYGIGMPFFPFLHCQAGVAEGEAVSIQSILPDIRKCLRDLNV